MLKPQAFANAVASVTLIAYIICGIIAFIAPNILLGIANSWLHTINIEAVRAATVMPLGTFIFGVVTLSGYVWVLTYAIAVLYNKFAK